MVDSLLFQLWNVVLGLILLCLDIPKYFFSFACSILQETTKSNLSDLVFKYSATPARRFFVLQVFFEGPIASSWF